MNEIITLKKKKRFHLKSCSAVKCFGNYHSRAITSRGRKVLFIYLSVYLRLNFPVLGDDPVKRGLDFENEICK